MAGIQSLPLASPPAPRARPVIWTHLHTERAEPIIGYQVQLCLHSDMYQKQISMEGVKGAGMGGEGGMLLGQGERWGGREGGRWVGREGGREGGGGQ